MHYSKTSFNMGELPTIVTNIPAFLDVIGQRMGFSDSDLLKLNRLYNCCECRSCGLVSHFTAFPQTHTSLCNTLIQYASPHKHTQRHHSLLIQHEKNVPPLYQLPPPRSWTCVALRRPVCVG